MNLTNIAQLGISICIVFDNEAAICAYKSRYTYNYEDIKFINAKTCINSTKLDYKETKECLFTNALGVKWGAGGHRNYVAVKRAYTVLYLENLGYKYVWCLDSESLVLKKTDLRFMIDSNMQKPILLLGQNLNGVKYPDIIKQVFGMREEWSRFKNISVRMNDFWFLLLVTCTITVCSIE